MSDTNTNNASARPGEENLSGGYMDSRAAFSPRLKEFREAMSILYIRNNASGRNKFRHKWPDVALFLFGEELIVMDNVGTQDRARRAELENTAGLRRIALKALMEEYEDKSVTSGVLNFEYIGNLLDKLGLEIGKLLYADDIIARVRPNLIAKPIEAQTPAPVITQPLPASEQTTHDYTPAEPVLTLDELAEKELAAQERMALRPAPEALSLDQLRREISSSDDFVHMKVEISDDIRPIETAGENLPLSTENMNVSLPQDLDQVQLQEPASVTIPPEIAEISTPAQAQIIEPVSSVPQPQEHPVILPEIQNFTQDEVQTAPYIESIPAELQSISTPSAPVENIYDPQIIPEAITVTEPTEQAISFNPVSPPAESEPVTIISEPEPIQTVTPPPAFTPPPEAEKKPRIQIAGLRIKDETTSQPVASENPVGNTEQN